MVLLELIKPVFAYLKQLPNPEARKLFMSKKGIELTMQVIVIVIVLLALLVFLLVFFVGRSQWLAEVYKNLAQGSVEATINATQ